jgi:hypothetical protein
MKMKKFLVLSAVLISVVGVSALAHGDEVDLSDPNMAVEPQENFQASADPQNSSTIAPPNTTQSCCGLGQFTTGARLTDSTTPGAAGTVSTRAGTSAN